eukprot:3939040-Pyramimonas_sp.AAC.1
MYMWWDICGGSHAVTLRANRNADRKLRLLDASRLPTGLTRSLSLALEPRTPPKKSLPTGRGGARGGNRRQ